MTKQGAELRVVGDDGGTTFEVFMVTLPIGDEMAQLCDKLRRIGANNIERVANMLTCTTDFESPVDTKKIRAQLTEMGHTVT